MVTFILFLGHSESDKGWTFYYDRDTNSRVETDLLTPLKQIGNVYYYTPKQYNLLYYTDKPNVKKLFDPDIDFDLDYLNISKHIDMIYEDVKQKYKPPYIPIGHSIGNLYALTFAKKHTIECMFTVSLDGSHFTKSNVDIMIEDYIKNYKNEFPNYKNENDMIIKSNNELQQLLNHIKSNSDNKKEIHKIFYHEQYSASLLAKSFLTEKLDVPLITFKDISLNDDQKKQSEYNKWNLRGYNEQQTLYKINKDNAMVRYMVNASHFPWSEERYRNEIVDTIKDYIKKIENEWKNKYKNKDENKYGGNYKKYMKYKTKYLSLKKEEY